MGLISRLLGGTDPKEVFKLADNPKDFVAALSRRRNWSKIDIHILYRIAENCEGLMELLQNFAYISEKTKLIEEFVALCAKPETIFGTPERQFSLTLYQFGSNLCKQIDEALSKNPEDSTGMIRRSLKGVRIMADCAFTSSIICDPLSLDGYAGMAYLYGSLEQNKKVGIEWCEKYLEAEKRLLGMNDDELSYYLQGVKDHLNNSELRKQTRTELAKVAPQLIGNYSTEESSTGDEVRNILNMLKNFPDR